MVIVKLTGGLGNQMFQYAAARRLAHVQQAPLKLDISWFEKVRRGDTRRQYELHVFKIKQDFASPQEVKELRGVDIEKLPRILKRFLRSAGFFVKQTYVEEKSFQFDPEILKLHDNVYLNGYWQSSKYFEDIENIIRNDFTFNFEPDSRNERIADEIRNCEAVSLHVRRGDYISNKAISQYHGSSSLNYYKSAIEEITAGVRNPHFFVFSDEPAWVKSNLKVDMPMTFLVHNGPEKGYEDLRLISLCRHHIIANSSFSWWGAWLSTNPGKIVIAPQKWFNREEIYTDDLIPQGWLRL